ncbi:MAG: glycerol-3-phosphate responsive antiterminator [Clostridia bacterium]|nr:glycerol-3-phosphate responsive antiterminator [Clostridia bacterium]
MKEIMALLEDFPVIAAVKDKNMHDAVSSPASIIFDLGANINTVKDSIELAHRNGKKIFVHIDLAEGIGKDRYGIDYLCSLGVDGIISTRGNLIKAAKDKSLLTVKRVFTLDSQGVISAMSDIDDPSADIIEIMPGVIPKIIERFAGSGKPIIAGGLIESKSEITAALSHGAVAVSTGKKELWYL